MKQIAVLDDYQGVALEMAPWETLAGRAHVVSFRDHVTDADALAARLAPFDAIVVNRERTPVGRSLIECLPRLRLVATSGMRNKAIDLAAAREAGVQVCGTETLGYPTAELTWALILAQARHLVGEANAVAAGGWQTTVGTGLRGKTLGVIGLGRIGAEVARIGTAFGMSVLAWSRNLTPEKAAACGARSVPFEDLLRQADVLSLHVPLTGQTRGLIGPAALSMMKPGAWLVNTARGGVVDEQALAEALRTRRIRGAALDVFEDEPLPAAHPLRGLPNALLTPHIGYVVEENYRRSFGQIVENLDAWLAGRVLRPLEIGSPAPKD